MNAYREKLALLSLEWDEGQHPRADDGKFTDGAGQDGSVSSIIGQTRGLDPARPESWYRNGPGWHVSNEGERPYGWGEVSPNYEPPEVQHAVLRMTDIGTWGGSHYGSQVITGDAAATMGLPGYKDMEATTGASQIATRMLEEIAKDQIGSEEPLYHSFENIKATVFRPGDTLRLPLLAASGKPETGYATRMEAEDQHGVPVVFAFPKGTPMVGYSTATLKDAKDLDLKTVKDVHKEFGHVWDEAIIAGGFRVDRVETVYMGSQHKRNGIKPGELTPQLYGQVVHLTPTEVYNPTTKKWVKRG